MENLARHDLSMKLGAAKKEAGKARLNSRTT